MSVFFNLEDILYVCIFILSFLSNLYDYLIRSTLVRTQQIYTILSNTLKLTGALPHYLPDVNHCLLLAQVQILPMLIED